MLNGKAHRDFEIIYLNLLSYASNSVSISLRYSISPGYERAALYAILYNRLAGNHKAAWYDIAAVFGIHKVR